MTKVAPPGHPVSQQLASMQIQKFMSRKVFYATPSTTIRMAMQMMLTHKVSGLAVVDDSMCCIGVYSELDAMLQGASHNLNSPIKYTKPPLMVKPTTPFREALMQMVQKKVKRLIVADDRKKLMGVVSRRDFMKAIYEDIQEVLK